MPCFHSLQANPGEEKIFDSCVDFALNQIKEKIWENPWNKNFFTRVAQSWFHNKKDIPPKRNIFILVVDQQHPNPAQSFSTLDSKAIDQRC